MTDVSASSRLHILESVMSTTPDFAYVFDRNARFVYANRRLLEVWGRSYDEAIGKGLAELGYEPWHVDMHHREIAQVIETKQPITGEVPFTGGSGISGVYEYIFTPVLDADGNVELIAGTTRDVTLRKRAEEEQRASEQKTRAILESITDAFFSVDREWRFTYLNRHAELVLGCEPGALLGKNIWDEFPGLLGTDFERMYRRAVQERESGEVTAYYPDHGRWYEVHTYPAPEGISVYFRDVNERKRAEEALRASEEALRRSDRSKDEFLATLAHELRNPLAPLRNTLHVLKLSDSAAAPPRMVEMMERQVNHLIRLVDDLLEVSRITSGKIELRKAAVDLREVAATAIETSKPLIEEAGHRLHVSLPEAPLFLEADAVRLAQVFANLLNNAAKFTGRNGEIWFSMSEQRGDIAISVRDTGIGIETAMLPQVFEMFTQVDRSPGRVQPGLGIGLSLARKLVQMHGGTVEARSAGLGQGSEFTVHLPSIPVSQPQTQQAPAAVALPPRRVLVVDDNHDAAESLGMLLEYLGADVQVRHDGKAALLAAESYKPAIVLLDIGMPGMDGYEVARAMRQQPATRDVPLVALTGWGNEEDRKQALAAGFDYHLVKPADLNALQALLTALEAPGSP